MTHVDGVTSRNRQGLAEAQKVLVNIETKMCLVSSHSETQLARRDSNRMAAST